MVPLGLAGLATRTPASGACSVGARQHFGRQHMAGGGVGLDLHNLKAERPQQVLVGRIAGCGDRHPLAGIEGAEEGQVEGGRGAGGHHDALGGNVEAVGFRIVAGNPRPERPRAQSLGVAEVPLRDRRADRRQHGFRRPRPRLADFHVDDARPGVLAVGGGAHDVHDDEGLDLAAPRGVWPAAHASASPPHANVLLPPNFPAMAMPWQRVALTRPRGLPNVSEPRQEQ